MYIRKYFIVFFLAFFLVSCKIAHLEGQRFIKSIMTMAMEDEQIKILPYLSEDMFERMQGYTLEHVLYLLRIEFPDNFESYRINRFSHGGGYYFAEIFISSGYVFNIDFRKTEKDFIIQKIELFFVGTNITDQ